MSDIKMRTDDAQRRLSYRTAGALALVAVCAAAPVLATGCSGDSTQDQTSSSSTGAGSSQTSAGSGGAGGGSTGDGGSTGTAGGGGTGGTATVDPGPEVDTSDPQLYKTTFKPDQADPAATQVLATQLGFLDTRVEPRGLLVVYLHGAGKPTTCGSGAHGEMLAGLGFHVLSPCYLSDYGVGNCKDDIEGCRMEAFEGVDHSAVINVEPPDSIEGRVVKGIEYLQSQNPKGDWTYFLDGDKPKWSKIVVSGISHGASSSAVIGKHRLVHRVVSLSGPLDTNQAWLTKPSITPIESFFAFSHTADDQHPGHLKSFEAMGLVGEPTSVDGASPPYGGSHRLITSADTSNGHGSTEAGGASPKVDNKFVFLPVWTYLYTDAQ